MKARYHKIILDPGESFTCKDWRIKFYDTPMAFLPEYIIMAMDEARGTLWAGDGMEKFQDGSLFLLGSNMPHYYVRDWSDPRPLQHFISASFDDGFLGETFFQVPETEPIRKMLARSNKHCLSFSRTTFERIFPELERASQASGWERLYLFLGVLGQLAAAPDSHRLASVKDLPKLDTHDFKRLSAVCRHVETFYGQEIREKDMAALAGLTPVSFSRFFHQRMHFTFTAYLTYIRISEACHRLTGQPDLNVLEVALQTGFNTLSNFNRQFRRLKGMTPSAFRRLHAGQLPLPVLPE